MELISGRRQLQPDVTSWFVQYCCGMLLLTTLPSCSPRRRETGLFGVVARTWVFNSFQSGLLHLATRVLLIIVLKLSLFSLSHISSSISKLCYLNLHLCNVSVSCHRVKIQSDPIRQTANRKWALHGQNCPTSQMKVYGQKIWTPIF